MAQAQVCNKCRRTLPIEEFYVYRDRTPSGINDLRRKAECKDCIRIDRKLKYDTDPELRAKQIAKSKARDRSVPTVAAAVHKKCEAWRDFLLANDTPPEDLNWRGVMQLMFFSRDHPGELRKLNEWSARVEKAMKGLGYAEDI